MTNESITSLSLTLFQLQQHCAVTGVAAEVTPALMVPEQLVLMELQLLGPLEPGRLQRGLVQVQQAADDERIVVQEARDHWRAEEEII